MSRAIFVNLAVQDLERSRAFFAALGFSFEAKFTSAQGTCMVVSDNIFVMLLVPPFFAGFTDRPLCDPRASTEVLLCLGLDSRAEVDAMTAAALAAGGREPRPAQDHGFMYQRGFEDPDGHLWELVHMSGDPP
jgi:predicted lactoylglutathione lyase